MTLILYLIVINSAPQTFGGPLIFCYGPNLVPTAIGIISEYFEKNNIDLIIFDDEMDRITRPVLYGIVDNQLKL